MEKRRKIDFFIHDNIHEKLIFRFYPRQSHCHSFGDEPPKSWNEVYKVYYAYSIIQQYKDNGKCEKSYIVFSTAPEFPTAKGSFISSVMTENTRLNC